MSWSVSIPEAVTADTLEEEAAKAWAIAAEEVERPATPPFYGGVPADQREPAKEAFDQGVKAAKALIESGAVGGDGKSFRVSLSGHANPGHEPTSGYATDMVTVSVNQVSPT